MIKRPFVQAAVLAGAIAAVLSMAGLSDKGFPQTQEPRKFQYAIVEVTTDVGAMQRMLNEYGAAGWELVTVGLGDMASPRLIFKK